MLYSLFLFKIKVLKIKEEDLESDKLISLEDIFTTSFIFKKIKLKRLLKNLLKKKSKIGPIKSLAFNKVNREKKIIIAKMNIKKLVLKKIKMLILF